MLDILSGEEPLSVPVARSDDDSAYPVIGGYGATFAGALLGGIVLGLIIATVGYRSSSNLSAGIYAVVGFVAGFACGEAIGAGLVLKLRGHRAAGATAMALTAIIVAGAGLELFLTLFGSAGKVSAILGLPALLIGAPLLARWWATRKLEAPSLGVDNSTDNS